MENFKNKLKKLFMEYEELISRKNIPVTNGNGVFTRYEYPILTAEHTPVFGDMIWTNRPILIW